LRSSRDRSRFSLRSPRLLPWREPFSPDEPLGLRRLWCVDETLGGGTGGEPSISGKLLRAFL
jgi:hypothetical protein